MFLFLLPFYKDFISEELFKKFNDTSKLVIEMKYDELTKFKELLLKSLLIINYFSLKIYLNYDTNNWMYPNMNKTFACIKASNIFKEIKVLN